MTDDGSAGSPLVRTFEASPVEHMLRSVWPFILILRASPMKLDHLEEVRYYRDGGSFEAFFRTDTGEPYVLTLKVRAFPAGGYGGLYESEIGEARRENLVEIGSPRAAEVLGALREWIERNISPERRAWLDANAPETDRDRTEWLLVRMVGEIPRRAST